MLPNLPEKYLSFLLPVKVVGMDERGLLQAFVSGYQDRLEDLRSYVKKFLSLLDPAGLGTEEVVLASVRSEQGLVFLRSLDVDNTTPTNQADLVAWVANTLVVEVSDVVSVTRGSDLLRESGAPTLYLLAATVGAALHQRIGTQDADTEALFVKFLQTYFDRLKLKGTVKSFEAIGHLIGFDEVSVQPLWGRLSPRISNDIGDGRNNPDFSPMPEFDVRQALGLFYNPHEFRDGPFFEWSGTVSPYVSDSRFYSQVVNGFNPWVRVSALNQTDVLVDSGGTMAKHPADGAYVLAGGSPHSKAGATITGTPLRFEALAEGDSFNGLEVHILSHNGSGTSADRLVRIYDRLSAVKYRTSYYDLGLAVTEEASAALFGNPPMRRNATLVATIGGNAVSPFRPWSGGVAAYSSAPFDYTDRATAGLPGSPPAPRVQSTRDVAQLDSESLLATAAQSAQVFEEVRSATRYPRTTAAGYVNNDEVVLARHRRVEPLFAMSLTSGSYGGTATQAPAGRHIGTIEVISPGASDFVPLSSELTATNVVSYTGTGISGTHNLSTNEWRFATVPAAAESGAVVALLWTPTDPELIRAEPAAPSTWSSGYTGGVVPVLAHDYNDFANWTVPAGYQVDFIGSNAFQVLDDVFPGQGVYANLSGVAEFGKMVSRKTFTWVEGSSYQFTTRLAGNHRLPVDSFLEIRFAGLTTTVTSAQDATFATATVVTHVASANGTGTLELELVGGVPGSGTLYASGTLTGPASAVLLSDDLNRSLLQSLTTSVVRANSGRRQAEDEQGETLTESMDDVPWRRDLTLGGELVDAGVYIPSSEDLIQVNLSDETAVRDQNGVEYRVYSVDSEAQPPRMVQVPVPTLEGYTPGKQAVGYRGTLRSLSDVPSAFWSTGSASPYPDERSGSLYRALGGLFTSNDVQLYHVGLVSGVLVADAPSFNGPHHRDGLALWLPFNEHPEDGLQVTDHSSFEHSLSVTGLSESARIWDSDFGWMLRMPAGFSASTSFYRGGAPDGAFFLRFKVAAQPTAVQEVLRVGGIRCGIVAVLGVTYFGVIESDGQITTRFAVALATTVFAGVSLTRTQMTLRTAGTTVTAASASSMAGEIRVSGGACVVTVSDLRVWSRPKTVAELDQVNSFQPKATACLYQLSRIESVNHQDKRAFKVLPSGLITLAAPPGAVRNEAQTRVRRYDGSGRYFGGAQFEEVGLGGGIALPPASWLLGSREQFLLSATGTTVVSGTHGQSGTNTAYSSAFSGVEAVAAFNTARDRLYIEGDLISVDVDAGWPSPLGTTQRQSAATVYEVVAEATESGPTVTAVLVATRSVRADYKDQPTGALTGVKNGTNRLSVSTAGVVYRKTGQPALTLPPAYLYAHSLLLESVPDAAVESRWEQPSTFGSLLVPPLAVLYGNGVLSFANGVQGGSLPSGRYRLRLDVGNLGVVDADFDGFSIEISIGDAVLQRRVLVDRTGSNFRQWEEIDFDLVRRLDNAYTLEINVLNAQHDALLGTSRRLIVYGYELRQMKTNLFRVSVGTTSPNGSGITVEHLPVAGATSTVETGGWRVAVSTAGQQVRWEHESQHYSELSQLPSAVLLTSSTSLRREDHSSCADSDTRSEGEPPEIPAPVLTVTSVP